MTKLLFVSKSDPAFWGRILLVKIWGSTSSSKTFQPVDCCIHQFRNILSLLQQLQNVLWGSKGRNSNTKWPLWSQLDLQSLWCQFICLGSSSTHCPYSNWLVNSGGLLGNWPFCIVDLAYSSANQPHWPNWSCWLYQPHLPHWPYWHWQYQPL